MKVSRRLFLKNGGIAIASVGLMPMIGPSFLRRAVFAADPTSQKRRKTLICIFQRGAADGLSMVVPHGDSNLYRLRPGLAIPRPTRGAAAGALDIDGFFGFHPSLQSFVPIFKEGHLAVVHACGSPHGTRSHFDAQDYMESGAPGDKSVRDGWVARTVLECPEDMSRAATPFRAVAMTDRVPRSMAGSINALAIPDLNTFGVGDGAALARLTAPVQRRGNNQMGGGESAGPALASGFETIYDQAVGDVLHGPGKESFEAIRMLKKANPDGYTPANGASYPNGRYGESLKQIAQLVKADVGLEVAFADSGGWDTHANQGSLTGRMPQLLNEFSRGIAALYQDLGDKMSDVVILTMSEFGRTARQNGTNGTDHGHATAFYVIGGDVQGGKVYGDWPGLAEEQLHQRRDLALTTDFRSVFGEVASRHLGAKELARVFPGFATDPAKFRGVLRG